MRRPYPDGRPPSIRDFMAFEEHIVNARRHRGQPVPATWYEIPVFYFTNPGAVFSDGDEIPRPADTEQLDYELELACVIGVDGRPEGFTIMNDFSARDLQAREMAVGLGPAKGKDSPPRSGPSSSHPTSCPTAWTCARSPGSTARCAPTATPAPCTTRGTPCWRPRRATPPWG